VVQPPGLDAIGRGARRLMGGQRGADWWSPRLPRHPMVAAFLLATLLACGCSGLDEWWHNGFKVGPNYATPAARVAPAWIDAGDRHLNSSPALDCGWWTAFGDPTLNGLIDAAYRENLDLKIAGTRILEARAQRNIAVGNLFPQSQSALADYAHAQVSKNLNVPIGKSLDVWATGFNASWEADFWGRFRRNVEANNAEVDASVQGYRDALVLLLSEVATDYVQLRTYQQRLAYGRRNVEIQRGSLRLADERFKKGTATELDVRQARANLAQTQSLLPPLEAGRRQASHRLSVLLGMPATDLAGLFPAAAIPKAPIEISVGVPADLLRRRPDILKAERELAAESARVGVAESDFYPRVTLNGFLGYTAKDLDELFEPKSFTGFILPTVQWPILNYGRIINGVRAQDARFQRAALQYQQTVLTASQEVEDALAGFLQTQQQANHLEDDVQQLSRAVELATDQFEGGLADFNRVFETQSSLVNAEDQLAVARGNIALNLIQAYKALGGGWEYFMQPIPQTLPPTAEEVAPRAEDKDEIPKPNGATSVAPNKGG
jgi:NodT family efflux transporter outer membrane factor (OMF) lipoprotein